MKDLHGFKNYPKVSLTMAQVHRLWGVPRCTLTWAIRTGRLYAVKVDGRYYVTGKDLCEWLLYDYKPRPKARHKRG